MYFSIGYFTYCFAYLWGDEKSYFFIIEKIEHYHSQSYYDN